MIIDKAKDVLKIEAQSLLNLIEKIDDRFESLVEAICRSNGRVIISGIGKSGLIGKKIVATLISTGTNAMFLHPVEALHGDLGMVSHNDIFIAISNSGETEELTRLLPLIKQMGCTLAGFTGKPASTMAGFCDIVIDTGVEKEACPLNMAPTSSTTAQLAMGDALAVSLINKKQFKKSDFMRSHPGGALGKRLNFRVGEVMFKTLEIPSVMIGTLLTDAIDVMDRFKLGAVIVLDDSETLKGIITDGDIRHLMAEKKEAISQENGHWHELPVEEIMSKNPHSLSTDSFLYDALNLMEKYQITVLPVVDTSGQLQGILHLHDILGKGSFEFNGGSQ